MSQLDKYEGAGPPALPEKDDPWIMRVYSGHSSAVESNELYRSNIERGQTGLSVAFDLPTQMAYGSSHPLAEGEVGRAGVPIDNLDDMRRLFKNIPLDEVNTAMTINAPAAWLLALYCSVADEQGVDRRVLRGTTQNDMAKEFLSRHLWAFPPDASFRIQADVIEFAVREMPNWNPVNFSSYHLQEAGATPVQEIAYTFESALSALDEFGPNTERAKRSGVSVEDVVTRSSFFLNAGIRFIEEMCKAKAMGELWDEYTRDRYNVRDPSKRRFRYGVQVNSVGLTAVQPENNIARIAYEALAVSLWKPARARAIQLPAWNEALGIPRPEDQQWSLRIQQILANETDILEYKDLFAGSAEIEAKVQTLKLGARAEQQKVEKIRLEEGRDAALAYMDEEIMSSFATHHSMIEQGIISVIGVNRFAEPSPSPLPESAAIVRIDPQAEKDQIGRDEEFRAKRDHTRVALAQTSLRHAAESGENLMPASIEAAIAGLTTREWGEVLEKVYGRHTDRTHG